MERAVDLTSSNSFYRDSLLNSFVGKISFNPSLDRTLVSFQANRKIPFYNWFKYKEGFSALLVESLVKNFGSRKGVLLDPFAGAGTSLFVSRSLGWDSVGIELLPIGPFVMEARQAAESVNHKVLKRTLEELPKDGWASRYDPAFAFGHIAITNGAFSPITERAIAGYRSYINRVVKNSKVRIILDFACFSVLESVSYTRKDGQYLRWDHRANKVRVGTKFEKGTIPSFDQAIQQKLKQIYDGIVSKTLSPLTLFSKEPPTPPGDMDLRIGSCLEELLDIESKSVDAVFTSPPYCNRYDYTRTYALELVYLGFDDQRIKTLRQRMLSCTVENRSKTDHLETLYSRSGRNDDFRQVVHTFENQRALHEVLQILESQNTEGALNNANIPRMVKNYFFEMCFVIKELARIVKKGREVVIVNDNVRYGGEEVPVDLILCDFAESFGFNVRHIWTLARGKGNSSQQMGVHGRTELRKCVYLWEKS